MMHQIYTMAAQTESGMIARQTQNEGGEGHVMKNDHLTYDYLNHFDL